MTTTADIFYQAEHMRAEAIHGKALVTSGAELMRWHLSLSEWKEALRKTRPIKIHKGTKESQLRKRYPLLIVAADYVDDEGMADLYLLAASQR